jgi:hypothetical protein
MSPNTNISPKKSSWDPSSLRLDQTKVARLQGGPRRGRRASPIRGKFIKGPLDFVWFSKARQLGVTALWVGFGLWFLRGLRRSNSFTVSNLMVEEWKIRPDAKARALRALEKAGLIRIERRGKRSPRVTLVVGNTNGGTVAADSGKPVDSFATLAAGGVAGTCQKRTSGLRRVAAGQLWLPGTSGGCGALPPTHRPHVSGRSSTMFVSDRTAPTRRSFTFLNEPMRQPPPSNFHTFLSC